MPQLLVLAEGTRALRRLKNLKLAPGKVGDFVVISFVVPLSFLCLTLRKTDRSFLESLQKQTSRPAIEVELHVVQEINSDVEKVSSHFLRRGDPVVN